MEHDDIRISELTSPTCLLERPKYENLKLQHVVQQCNLVPVNNFDVISRA